MRLDARFQCERFAVLPVPSPVASREDFSPCSLCQRKHETQRSLSVSVRSVLVLLKAQSTRRRPFGRAPRPRLVQRRTSIPSWPKPKSHTIVIAKTCRKCPIG
jgi:hypothetical protein